MPAWARSWSPRPSLLEAELFGRLRPGLHGTASLGRAELAHSGTLLLDRVSAASHSAQARLLRLLETGMVERDGAPLTAATARRPRGRSASAAPPSTAGGARLGWGPELRKQ
jgi:transcriptional regulator with AAA-type ATPase domain